MTKTFNRGLAALVTLVIAGAAPTGVATADPAEFDDGFGNAQNTVDALKAQGYDVELNGAVVYPMSGCKVTGVEGLRNSNASPSGDRIDRAHFDTVYVDVACRGG